MLIYATIRSELTLQCRRIAAISSRKSLTSIFQSSHLKVFLAGLSTVQPISELWLERGGSYERGLTVLKMRSVNSNQLKKGQCKKKIQKRMVAWWKTLVWSLRGLRHVPHQLLAEVFALFKYSEQKKKNQQINKNNFEWRLGWRCRITRVHSFHSTVWK